MIDPINLMPSCEPYVINSKLNRITTYFATYYEIKRRLFNEGVSFAPPNAFNSEVSVGKLEEKWAALWPEGEDPPYPLSDVMEFEVLASPSPLEFGDIVHRLCFQYLIKAAQDLDAIDNVGEGYIERLEKTRPQVEWELLMLRYIAFDYSQLAAALMLLNVFCMDNRGRPEVVE